MTGGPLVSGQQANAADVTARKQNPAGYVIWTDGNNYFADSMIGTADFTESDFWKLLNDIDGVVSIGTTHIHVKGSSYTYAGSTTFTPHANKGFLITGDGIPVYDGVNTLPAIGGTILVHTGTGSAIDTSVNWTAVNWNLNDPNQVIGIRDLAIQAPAASVATLKIRYCNRFTARDCILSGNIATTPVAGSIGISLPDSAGESRSVIDNCTLTSFATDLSLSIDHLSIRDSEIMRSSINCIAISGGNEVTFTNNHFFGGGIMGSITAINDTRPPTNGFTLIMSGNNFEGVGGNYDNNNGGYYILMGNGLEGAGNNAVLQSNLGGGIAMDGGQTTLNGTTAGSIVYSMPFRGVSLYGGTYKKFIGWLNGYQNNTGTAQTITFASRYQQNPAFTKDDSGGSAANSTTLTLPINMGVSKTGWIIVEGY